MSADATQPGSERTEARTPRAPRRVLFLQGPPSPFWHELAGAFEAAGHATFRINLCTADSFYWRRRGADAYRGGFAGWRDHLSRYLDRNRITDILYYADRQPYHVVAGELAAQKGIDAYVTEFGYLRPDWITLERTGMGAFSRFPDDPEAIRRIAADSRKAGFAPDLKLRYPHDFGQEAFNEVVFNLLNSLFCWPYPRFRMDRRYHPLVDFLSWLPRLARQGRAARRAEEVTRACAAGAYAYDLVALQLQSDYQVRDNSHYAGLEEMIAEVIASFAAHAPADRRLIFKLHPLDNGFENWPRQVAGIAAAHGVGDRAETIDGGQLDVLIGHAHGVIAVNSTVGLHGIRAGRPTLILGKAIFDVAGLTHQGPIDAFWTEADRVDPALAEDLAQALAAAIQVKGSFYNPEGRARAQAEIVARVAEGRVNEPGAWLPAPPRLPVGPRAADLAARPAGAAAGISRTRSPG